MAALKNLYWRGVNKAWELKDKKVEGDSHFLAIAVALILVVVIGLLFKTQLTALFNSIFTNTTTKVNGMFN